MKIMAAWSIRSKKLKETGNGPLKTSGLWIRQTLGVIAVALSLSLQAVAATDDIDEQIREKQKLLEQLKETYEFLKLFESPGTWAVEIWVAPKPFVIPVSRIVMERALGARYVDRVFSGKMTVKEYEKEVSSVIREMEDFDRSFKFVLKQKMSENKAQQEELRTEIAALQKRKALASQPQPSKGAEAKARAEIAPTLEVAVVGTYDWFNNLVVTVKEDYTLESRDSGGNIVNTGHWEVIDRANRKVKLTWKEGGWIDEMTFYPDRNRLEGMNNIGSFVWGKKR